MNNCTGLYFCGKTVDAFKELMLSCDRLSIELRKFSNVIVTPKKSKKPKPYYLNFRDLPRHKNKY